MSDTNNNHAHDQAIAQANSITAMVAALEVDYDRLEELRTDLMALESDVQNTDNDEAKHAARFEVECWRNDHAEELRELEEAANGNDDEDEAREAIQDDALDVQVRADWHSPGDKEASKPSEFMILLCTGGPAVRIVGELNQHSEPCRAWIEYQDWGTPWTEAVGVIEQSVLLEYCQQFYFGE